MVWHLSLDRHRESILVAFADLLTSPASRRELAHSDIAGMYRMLCDAGISQASMQRARNSCESAHDEQRPCKHFASSVVAFGKRLRSVSLLRSLASSEEAAAARQDSACQDLAGEVAMLRGAA